MSAAFTTNSAQSSASTTLRSRRNPKPSPTSPSTSASPHNPLLPPSPPPQTTSHYHRRSSPSPTPPPSPPPRTKPHSQQSRTNAHRGQEGKDGKDRHDNEQYVYLFNVKPETTLEGVAIAFDIPLSVVRRVNGLWPSDGAQAREVLVLPIEECGVRGVPRRIEGAGDQRQEKGARCAEEAGDLGERGGERIFGAPSAATTFVAGATAPTSIERRRSRRSTSTSTHRPHRRRKSHLPAPPTPTLEVSLGPHLGVIPIAKLPSTHRGFFAAHIPSSASTSRISRSPSQIPFSSSRLYRVDSTSKKSKANKTKIKTATTTAAARASPSSSSSARVDPADDPFSSDTDTDTDTDDDSASGDETCVNPPPTLTIPTLTPGISTLHPSSSSARGLDLIGGGPGRGLDKVVEGVVEGVEKAVGGMEMVLGRWVREWKGWSGGKWGQQGDGEEGWEMGVRGVGG